MERNFCITVGVYMYIVQRNPEKMMELWQVLKKINPCFVRTYLNGDNGKVLQRKSECLFCLQFTFSRKLAKIIRNEKFSGFVRW